MILKWYKAGRKGKDGRKGRTDGKKEGRGADDGIMDGNEGVKEEVRRG